MEVIPQKARLGMKPKMTANSKKIIAAFEAALLAVNPKSLFSNNLYQNKEILHIFGCSFDWEKTKNIYVIGAGKASGLMAEALEQSILACPDGVQILSKIKGIVNVVEGDKALTKQINLIEARPTGKNQVTKKVIESTSKMLSLIATANKNDVVIDLVSGGGSALREHLVEGITLEDLLLVQDSLASVDIAQLNAVRKHCSKVKGGAMNHATSAGLVVALILSDVIGDPLDVIASGPWAENLSSPTEVLSFLEEKGLSQTSPKIFFHLKNLALNWKPVTPGKNVFQYIIGSNAIALSSFQETLTSFDFEIVNHGSELSGYAKDVGVAFAEQFLEIESKNLDKPLVHIYGGETIVLLDTSAEGRLGGGRNQRIVLSALNELFQIEETKNQVLFFSLGTDGEDGRGPKPVAGVIAGFDILKENQNPKYYLDRCDEYAYFDKTDAHVVTGLTGTNVCDIMGFIVF